MNLDYENLDKVVSGSIEIKNRGGPQYIEFCLVYTTKSGKTQEYIFPTKDMQVAYTALNGVLAQGKISYVQYDELETTARQKERLFLQLAKKPY